MEITTRNKKLWVTAAMRQAGNPSSVDKLRMREMSVFKRTIPGKSPARRIAAKRYLQAETKNPTK